MAEAQYIIPSAEALYPKIDQTYKFDQTANRSVTCDPFDDGAAYELNFKLSESEAKKLYKAMKAYWIEKKEDNWPDKFPNPFKKQEDGTYEGKTRLKGAFGKDASRKPLLVDSKNTPCGDDFRLTSGSVVNISVTFVPYRISANNYGVSLRINAVQVLKYEPMKASSPFAAVSDGFVATEASPFSPAPEEPVTSTEDDDDGFGDEEDLPPVAEPKKKVVKKSAPAPTDAGDLSSIIDAWDDED
tara:strand:+ start:164 stop:892 length:729 start_codon:yes stop_codon:yes gene_type:complete